MTELAITVKIQLEDHPNQPRNIMTISSTHFVTKARIAKFAEATGDFNPIHVDPDYAATTKFKKNIAHGVLILGLISADITKHYGSPKRTPILLYTEFNFLNPVFEGDAIEITFYNPIQEGKNTKLMVSVVKKDGDSTGCVDGYVLIR